MREEKNMLYSR